MHAIPGGFINLITRKSIAEVVVEKEGGGGRRTFVSDPVRISRKTAIPFKI